MFLHATRRATFVVLLIVAVVVGWRLVAWRPIAVASAPQSKTKRLSGALHVHTTLSDGRGSPEEVIAAAKAAGLDYLILTDHDGFDGKHLQGYSGDLLVIVGTEISTRAGHILAFGLPEPSFRFSDDPSEVLDDIGYLGGTAVVAHPENPRQDFIWTQWDLEGSWGLEILNGDAEWRSMSWIDTARLFFTYPLNPSYALVGMLKRPDELLQRWDQLLTRRNTSIVVGADAHGFPSYESMFNVARNHLLLDTLSGDARTDIAAVSSALQRGAGYVGIDGLASTEGFFFVAEQGGRVWTIGDTVPVEPAPGLRAGGVLPSGAIVSLLRNGQRLTETTGDLDWPVTAAGVYRVEVRIPGWRAPWILSNPIYVFDEAADEVRRQQERGPELVTPDPRNVLADFNHESPFVAASDPSTVVDDRVLAPSAGADGSSAARLSFTLGVPTVATPSPFAALASARQRDLSGHHGLLFSIKSDAVYRVWVQVRDANPESEEGTEWWYSSVRTGTEWRRIAVPFERLRTRDANSDGDLDLSETIGLYFIVDTRSVRPGTEGTIWVDDLGVY